MDSVSVAFNTVDTLSAIKYTVKPIVTKMATSTITKQSVNTHVRVKMIHVLTGASDG